MDNYSTEGLRTLCLAKRVLSLEQYRYESSVVIVFEPYSRNLAITIFEMATTTSLTYQTDN